MNTQKLSYSELRYIVLSTIHQHKTITTRELQSCINILRPSLSRCIAHLERNGFIIREKFTLSLSLSGQQKMGEFAAIAKQKGEINRLKRLLFSAQHIMNGLADSHYDEELRQAASDLSDQIDKEVYP